MTMPWETHHRQTAREFVVNTLRDQILSGELAPGERLTVPEVASRLNVSQTPAREALQQLETEQLVSISPYKGARVAELDADECEEIYLMREALERLAAREGTEAITPEAIARMEGYLHDMAEAAKAQDIERFVAADRAFHSVHYSASGRNRLWERILSLRYSGERYTRLSYQSLPHELELSIPRHSELMDFVRARDAAGAESWVARTLRRVPEQTRTILEQRPSAGEAEATRG